jgi:hypothetical protein
MGQHSAEPAPGIGSRRMWAAIFAVVAVIAVTAGLAPAAMASQRTRGCEGVRVERSYDETAVLQALLAAGHDLSKAEVADVAVSEADGDEGRVRVVLDWRLSKAELDRVLADSVRYEANACS